MNQKTSPNSRMGIFNRRLSLFLPGLLLLSILPHVVRTGQPLWLLLALWWLPWALWARASGWMVSEGRLHVLNWPRWRSAALKGLRIQDHKPFLNLLSPDLVAHPIDQEPLRLHAGMGGLRWVASIFVMKQEGAEVESQFLGISDAEIPERESFSTSICFVEFRAERVLVQSFRKPQCEAHVHDAVLICECQQNWLFSTQRLVFRQPDGVILPVSVWGSQDDVAASWIVRAFAARGGMICMRQGRSKIDEDWEHDLAQVKNA